LIFNEVLIEMKNRNVFFVSMLTMSLLMSCNPAKHISNNSNKDGKIISSEIAENQQLTKKDVAQSQKPVYVNTVSGKKQVVAASSYNRELIYAKTKEQIKEEKRLAKAKAKAKKAPATVIQIKTEPVVQSVKIIDTLTFKNDGKIALVNDSTTIKALKPDKDSAAVQVLFKPEDAAKYIRTNAQLKKYSAVAGSFSTLEKAYELVMELVKEKYRPIIVKNEKGMFRVITGTYNDRDNADIDRMELELDHIKSWVLIKK